MRTLRIPLSALVIAVPFVDASRAQVTFEVSVAAGMLDAPQDGRVFDYLVGSNRRLREGDQPAQWDFWHEPMPLYAIDVKQLGSGTRVVALPLGYDPSKKYAAVYQIPTPETDAFDREMLQEIESHLK